MSKTKLIIILTVLLDAIGVGIVVPVMPYYVDSLGISSLAVTLLFAAFSLFSFLSSPLLGALSDRLGRRPILILSIASTAIGWLIFASAKSVWGLLLGRVIDGLAAGNFPIAQSYLVDIAKDEKERTANIGLIGAIFGVGFIVGPVLGAAMTGFSHALPFWVVGALASLNAIGAFFFLPETNRHTDKTKRISFNPLTPLRNATKDRLLRSRYIVWFLFGLAFSSHQSIFALYLKDNFGYDATMAGYIFAAIGLMFFFNQAVAMKHFWLKHFREAFLEVWSLLAFTLSFVMMSLGVKPIFFLGLAGMATAQSVMRVVISSTAAGLAGKLRRGEVMGVMSSILSFAMIIGPLVAGWLYHLGRTWPFAFSALALSFAFVVMRWFNPADMRENYLEAEQPQVVG